MRSKAEIVAAARACVGARFRLHGRDPAWGLDCVGVVARAFAIAVPAHYAIRGQTEADVAALVAATGLRPCPIDAAGAGDLLLLRAGPSQLHLVVRTAAGFVHAHAGLRRVVETPGTPPGPVIGAWRWGEKG